MKKITSIILYVLLGLGVLSVIPTFIYGADGVDYMLYYTYVLLGIAILSAVVMSVVNIGKNPSGGKMALVGIAVVVAVLIVSYFLSSSDPIPVKGGKEFYEDTFGLMVTDMGLYTTYFALGAAIVVTFVGAIRNSFK